MSSATGDFGLVENGLRPRWFLAGGTGLSPLMSMLRRMAEWGDPQPARLFFGVTRHTEVFAQEELQALADSMPDLRYDTVVWHRDPEWSGATGNPVDLAAAEAALLDEWPDVYVCGPPPMVDAAYAALTAVGIPEDQIHAETVHQPAGRPARRWSGRNAWGHGVITTRLRIKFFRPPSSYSCVPVRQRRRTNEESPCQRLAWPPSVAPSCRRAGSSRSARADGTRTAHRGLRPGGRLPDRAGPRHHLRNPRLGTSRSTTSPGDYRVIAYDHRGHGRSGVPRPARATASTISPPTWTPCSPRRCGRGSGRSSPDTRWAASRSASWSERYPRPGRRSAPTPSP